MLLRMTAAGTQQRNAQVGNGNRTLNVGYAILYCMPSVLGIQRQALLLCGWGARLNRNRIWFQVAKEKTQPEPNSAPNLQPPSSFP